MMAPRRQEHGWAGGGEMGVGGFFFVTARRSRNPRGEKFFEKCLSVHVSNGNLRGEKFFKKFLSAHVVLGAPDRPRYQPKPARNGLAGGPGALVRARYQPKPARNGHAGGPGAPVRHQWAERSWKRSFSPRTFRPETCVKRSFSKSISPHRFRFRQTVPKRCQKGTRGHHDGNPLPS